MSDPSIELSMSFLKKVHEDLSLSGFEDNSIFKNIEDSLIYSPPMSHNTSDQKPFSFSSSSAPQQPSYPKEISFNVSELSKKSENFSILQNLKISHNEVTLPTTRCIQDTSKDLLNIVNPIQLFCKTCEKAVKSVVSYELQKENWWQGVVGMLQKIKCCGEGYQDYAVIHKCKYCGGVLARILPSQGFMELRRSQ